MTTRNRWPSISLDTGKKQDRPCWKPLQGVDASFIAPVFPGDELTVFGEIFSIHQVFKQIEIRAHITNQIGKKVSKAKIRSGINE